ncbi:fructokinase-like 1 [Actinidia rufa]|uniref:Fructokinase-like 1 n=1 Tax=Actinidia rufa TaxID=165716 RepID=A0A7J0E727_9ERIC|nr:fructokinase-like 1 [Actinidia rufa]
MLQWKPPEFARAPGGSAVEREQWRKSGLAAFMGKVVDDEFGDKMVYLMNKLRVQTRVVKFDGDKMTGCARMRIGFNEGRRTWRTGGDGGRGGGGGGGFVAGV